MHTHRDTLQKMTEIMTDVRWLNDWYDDDDDFVNDLIYYIANNYTSLIIYWQFIANVDVEITSRYLDTYKFSSVYQSLHNTIVCSQSVG